MITREDVKKSADVSRITIDEMELEKYTDDLNDMIKFINMINNKSFSDENTFECFHRDNLKLRDDEVFSSLSYEDVFRNTSLRVENFFELKRKE